MLWHIGAGVEEESIPSFAADAEELTGSTALALQLALWVDIMRAQQKRRLLD